LNGTSEEVRIERWKSKDKPLFSASLSIHPSWPSSSGAWNLDC
jgi:hypothetical protein